MAALTVRVRTADRVLRVQTTDASSVSDVASQVRYRPAACACLCTTRHSDGGAGWRSSPRRLTACCRVQR